MKAKRNPKGSSCSLTGQNCHQLAGIKTCPASPGDILGLVGKIWDSDQGPASGQGSEVTHRACKSHAFGLTHRISISFSTEQHQERINLLGNLGYSYQRTAQIFCRWVKRPDGSPPLGIPLRYISWFVLRFVAYTWFLLFSKYRNSLQAKLSCIPRVLSLGRNSFQDQNSEKPSALSLLFSCSGIQTVFLPLS